MRVMTIERSSIVWNSWRKHRKSLISMIISALTPHGKCKADESAETDRKKLCWEFHSFFVRETKDMYQCSECGRVFVEDKNGEMREFASTESVDKSIFKNRR